MSATCDLSDLPADQCACRVHKPAEVVESNAFDVVRSFPARFGGRLVCGHWTNEGETIHRTTDGDVVCGECVS